MKNLLKSDFYRLFRSLSFYICTAVSVILYVSAIFLLKLSFKLLESQGINSPFPYKDGLHYGLAAFSDGTLRIILAVFIAIFVTSEFSHGTMKNTVSKGFSRRKIFCSKLITMSAAAFIMLLITVITATLAGGLITGSIGGYMKDHIKDALLTTGVECLLFIAFAAILVMLSNTIRNLGGAISLAIIGAIILEPQLFNALEVVIKSKIDFSMFSLGNNIVYYANVIGASATDYIRSLIVAAVFFIIATVFGVFMFKKSDVK